MRGVTYGDLAAIIDFLYRGKANVFQENLDRLLTIAEELQITGLLGQTVEKVKEFDSIEKLPLQLSQAFNSGSLEEEFKDGLDNIKEAALNNFFMETEDAAKKIKKEEDTSDKEMRNGSKGNVDYKNKNVKTSLKGRSREPGEFERLDNFSWSLEELDAKVKSMMEKSENRNQRNARADRCKVCGKEGHATAIKDHIEANHIEGIIIPCNICDKTFRSKD